MIVIVHAGQIVMNEGIDMHAFGSGGDAKGGVLRDTEKRGALADEEGPEALAAAQRRIAHRLRDAAFRAVGPGQQALEHLLHIGGACRERGLESSCLCGGRCHASADVEGFAA